MEGQEKGWNGRVYKQRRRKYVVKKKQMCLACHQEGKNFELFLGHIFVFMIAIGVEKAIELWFESIS